MRIELTDEEASILEEILRTTLSDVRMEIADTDNSQFKAQLRTHKAAVQAVLDRLTAGQAQ